MNGPNPAKISNYISRLLYDSDFMPKSSILLLLQYVKVQAGSLQNCLRTGQRGNVGATENGGMLDFDIPKMRIWHGMTWDNMGQSDRRGNFTGSIINLIWFEVSVNIWYWIRYNLQLECRTWWKGLDTSLDFDSCLAGHMDKTPFLMRLSQA